MAWYLTREYGNTVEVHYHDLSQADNRRKFPDVTERLRRGDLVLPAVFVDDEVVALGSVDYFSVARAIEKARKNGHGGE